MDFYKRNIRFYKSLNLIDSDGDGVKDTIVYAPTSSKYYIQLPINQDIKDIGNYHVDDENSFEIFESNDLWDKNNGLVDNPPNVQDKGDTNNIGFIEFCNDPDANNYNPDVINNPAYIPCSDCCTYNTTSNRLSNPDLECLVIYTDWGPWNGSLIKNNSESYFDFNGDGFIENIVDNGLFSKTRYDSPYIYIKPGTTDGTTPIIDNILISNQSNNLSVGNPSQAGWRQYPYKINQTITSYANTSPTCQLGGCDNYNNIDPSLVDVSNSNIFLPQSDFGLSENSSCANFNNFGLITTVTHTWNSGLTDAKGGCCAKQYDTTLTFSSSGPYLNSDCSTCHSQMTTRSAQPILDNNTRVLMQTTNSDVYYGPFYDPQNPTYNGYGLAFSKANKFCRDVKGKNGVEIINSLIGTEGNILFIGGILHGGAEQVTPTMNITDGFGVTEETTKFNSTNNCSQNTKLPLKCVKAVNDPNCPNNNCMKCVYCFKCSTDEVQAGVFTGYDNNINNGPSNGIIELN